MNEGLIRAIADYEAAYSTGSLKLSDLPSDGTTVIIAGDTYEFDAGDFATGNITLGSDGDGTHPEDGDTIAVSLGEEMFAVFEFQTLEEEVTEGNLWIELGETLADTGDALVAALEANLALAAVGGVIEVGVDDDYSISLSAAVAGEAGEFSLITDGTNLAATSMTGGVEPGEGITEGHLPVMIDASITGTHLNLLAAINAAGKVKADFAPGGSFLTLRHETLGSDGNVEVTTDEEHLTVTGLTGGREEVTLRTLLAGILGIVAGDIEIGNVGVLNTDSDAVDPATEDGQEAILAAIEAQQSTVLSAMHPAVITALGTRTTTDANWDSDAGAEIAIPAGTVFLHIHVTEDCYLIPSANANDPATSPAVYAAAQTYVVPCKGQTHLHYKRAGASNATVSVTAFGN